MSCSPSPEPFSPQTKHRNTFLHEVYKSKITMADHPINDTETQCTILSFTEYQKYEHFIEKIVPLLNETLEAKIHKTISSQIYPFGELEE